MFPKWRPNKNNPDLEIIEREYAGRIAEMNEVHQAKMAELSAKLADINEQTMIARGLHAQKMPELRAELAAAERFIAEWPARQAAMADELAAAKATANERALEMCAAAGIEPIN